MLYSFEVVILNTEMRTWIFGPFSQLSQTLVHIPHGRPLGPVERFHGKHQDFFITPMNGFLAAGDENQSQLGLGQNGLGKLKCINYPQNN